MVRLTKVKLLINSVRLNKPKMLIGLVWSVNPFQHGITGIQHHRKIDRA